MNKKQCIRHICILLLVLSFIQYGAALTYEEAQEAINESQQSINEMIEEGFPILVMNDTLIEAKRILEQARYAAIARGEVEASLIEKRNVLQALELIDWKELNYTAVLAYTNTIQERREELIKVHENIEVVARKIDIYYANKVHMNKSNASSSQLLQEAQKAFQQDRLNEASTLTEEARVQLEEEQTSILSLHIIEEQTKSFLTKNWMYIMVVLIGATLFVRQSTKTVKQNKIRNKIKHMKIEEKILKELIKEAQEQRFKTAKISALTYKIRVQKYKERMNQIKEELPVLNKQLKRKGRLR